MKGGVYSSVEILAKASLYQWSFGASPVEYAFPYFEGPSGFAVSLKPTIQLYDTDLDYFIKKLCSILTKFRKDISWPVSVVEEYMFT